MTKLRLDLETLEVERLDTAVTELNGGVELLGVSHASTELGHSCNNCNCSSNECACGSNYCDASCTSEECDCNTA